MVPAYDMTGVSARTPFFLVVPTNAHHVGWSSRLTVPGLETWTYGMMITTTHMP